MLRKSLFLGAVLSVLALATSAQADFTFGVSPNTTTVRDTPVTGEQTILAIYNHVYAVELTSDLTWSDLNAYFISPQSDQLWDETMGTVIARARFAGYQQRFGYYTDLGVGSARTQLIEVTNDSGYLSDPGVFYDASSSSQIGFYRTGPDGNLWFSEVALNTRDHADHLVAFWSPYGTSCLLFWEDLPRCSWDYDYNDLAVQLVGVGPGGGGGPIPEPSSMLLVLAGLGGLAYWRRSR